MALVLYQTADRIAYITLNRPQKRNALNDEMVQQLTEAFERASVDAEVKVIVLRASGKVFSAGADLDYLQGLQKNTFEENLADSIKLKQLLQAIYTHDKVIIAQVQGHAIAGGCGLATVCDFVIADVDAKFGYTEVHIGFIPAIVMVYLLRRLGEGAARDLLISGRLIDANQAQKWGLANQTVSSDELESAVATLAHKLIDENSAQSMQRTKAMIARIQEMDLTEALDFATDQNARARSTEDCRAGIKAFLDKTPIKW